jgi:hypothetical protein
MKINFTKKEYRTLVEMLLTRQSRNQTGPIDYRLR